MDEIDLLGNPEPTYIQIANAIAARIEVGKITYRLPGERALALEFGVAYQTLRHAMKLLRERGLVITRQGAVPLSWPRPRPMATMIVESSGPVHFARLGKSGGILSAHGHNGCRPLQA